MTQKQNDSDLTGGLTIRFDPSVTAHNGGLFVSRGEGIHPTRMIDTYELILVRSGTLSMFEENREFELSSGQTLLLRKGRRHGGAKPYPRDLSFFWLHFDFDDSLVGHPTVGIPQVVVLPEPDRVTTLCRRFLDDQETRVRSRNLADLTMTLILAEVVEAHADSKRTPSNPLVEQMRTFIELHATEIISTASIAKTFRRNPDYLGRIFKRFTGRTLTEAIHEKRIKLARQLLMDSHLNIDEIAGECGFDDATYFRRVFKRLTDTTPLAFRTLHSKIHVNTR